MSTSSASPYSNDPARTERCRAVSAGLARNWWAVALRGVAAIAFGVIALLLPGVAMLSLVFVFAVYMFVDGFIGIIAATRAANHGNAWGLLAAGGVASIVAGVLAAVWPGITVLVFVMLIAVAQIFSGIVMLRSASLLEQDHGRWWLAIGGVLSIAFGILLILTPLIGALVLTWWLGVYALVMGVLLLSLGFRLRSRHLESTRAAPNESEFRRS